MGLGGVFINMEDADVVVAWVLAMHEVGMSIIMHQLKMKVAELTQTMATPFQNGITSTTCITGRHL